MNAAKTSAVKTAMIRLLILVLCLLPPVALAGTPKDATATVQKANARFRQLLEKKVPPGSAAEKRLAHQLTRDMRRFFDIRDLTRRALVDHWDAMDEARRDDLVATLQQIIEQNYINSLRSNLAYDIEYTGEERRKDGESLVKTLIKATRRGRPASIEVSYVLYAAGDGWRVFDVITDGVSLVKNYRSMFNRIIKKEGVDGLLVRMKEKLASLQKQDAASP